MTIGFGFQILWLKLQGDPGMVLLILINQIIHIALWLSELHLIHTFAGVPMKESLPPKHSCELLAHTPEHLLN